MKRKLALLSSLMVVLMLRAVPVAADDWSDVERQHCGPNAFSPRYEHCEQFNSVPEPGTFYMTAAGLALLVVMRRRLLTH